MDVKIPFHAELREDGTIEPFQLGTGHDYTVIIPSRKVHIRLLDEDGEPRAQEPYRMVLSNGETIEGHLDEQGEARVDTPDGTARVSFPELAGAAPGEGAPG